MLAIALPVVGVAALSAIVALPPASSARLAEPPSFAEVVDRSVLVGGELAHAGLTPDVFASAGLSAEQVSQLIPLLNLDSDGGIDRYRAARVAHAEAAEACEARVALVQAGRASGAEITGLRDLRTALDAASDALVAAESALIQAAETVMTREQASALATIRANDALGVPMPYAATRLTAQERFDLREALAAAKYAERNGTELDQEAAALLTALDVQGDVSGASGGLDELSFVRSAYGSALAALNN